MFSGMVPQVGQWDCLMYDPAILMNFFLTNEHYVMKVFVQNVFYPAILQSFIFGLQ